MQARGDKQHVMVADLRETESIALAKGVKVQCTLFDSSRNTKEPRSRSGPSWPRMCCSKHSVGVETASIRSNSHAAKYMNQRWEENCFPESGLMSINTSSASNAAWGARGSGSLMKSLFQPSLIKGMRMRVDIHVRVCVPVLCCDCCK